MRTLGSREPPTTKQREREDRVHLRGKFGFVKAILIRLLLFVQKKRFKVIAIF